MKTLNCPSYSEGMSLARFEERLAAVTDPKVGLAVAHRFSHAMLSLASTFVSIKSSAGTLRGFLIGGVSTPALTVYDNVSGPSGTIIADFEVNASRGNLLIDTDFLNGLTIKFGPGANPKVTALFK